MELLAFDSLGWLDMISTCNRLPRAKRRLAFPLSLASPTAAPLRVPVYQSDALDRISPGRAGAGCAMLAAPRSSRDPSPRKSRGGSGARASSAPQSSAATKADTPQTPPDCDHAPSNLEAAHPLHSCPRGSFPCLL